MLMRLYYHRHSRHVGLVTARFSLIAFPTLAWLRPGWWLWERVAGTLIVRFGPCVLTVWRAAR